MFEALPGYLFTAAFIWLLAATVWRLAAWALTPSPLPIPLAPTPRTRVGVAGRLMLECFAFRSLARADKVTWLASLAFHYGLLLVLVVHLRFVLPQLPLWLMPFIRISGWATAGLMLGLAVLLLRRIIVDRIRYISAPSDYLHLLLLLAIAGFRCSLEAIVADRPVCSWAILAGCTDIWLASIALSCRPLAASDTGSAAHACLPHQQVAAWRWHPVQPDLQPA